MLDGDAVATEWWGRRRRVPKLGVLPRLRIRLGSGERGRGRGFCAPQQNGVVMEMEQAMGEEAERRGERIGDDENYEAGAEDGHGGGLFGGRRGCRNDEVRMAVEMLKLHMLEVQQRLRACTLPINRARSRRLQHPALAFMSRYSSEAALLVHNTWTVDRPGVHGRQACKCQWASHACVRAAGAPTQTWVAQLAGLVRRVCSGDRRRPEDGRHGAACPAHMSQTSQTSAPGFSLGGCST